MGNITNSMNLYGRIISVSFEQYRTIALSIENASENKRFWAYLVIYIIKQQQLLQQQHPNKAKDNESSLSSLF